MNIKKYKEEGLIEYLPQYSFMNHEIVVFEEIFDAPASVLLSLKDIMTSKKFRQGHETFNVKTKVIIGLTNRSKKEFTDKDDSLAALAERFPLTYKVEWDSYSNSNFTKLFKKVYTPDFYETHKSKLASLASILNLNNTDGTSFVSPRTAVSAGVLFAKGKSLEYISDIDPEIIKKYNNEIIVEELNAEQGALLKNIDNYIKENELEIVDQDEAFLMELNQVEMAVGSTPIDLTGLNLSSKDSISVKINKVKFLIEIVDRQKPIKSNFNKFNDYKKKLKDILATLEQGYNKK